MSMFFKYVSSAHKGYINLIKSAFKNSNTVKCYCNLKYIYIYIYIYMCIYKCMLAFDVYYYIYILFKRLH